VSQSPVILGIDFGGTKIAVAACGLTGNRLGAGTVTVAPAEGARANFDRGIQAARGLLASVAATAPLAAVGVSTFGIPFEDRVDLAPAIDGWGALPLGRELRAAFPGTEIRMATDAKAAARAEARWGALAGADPAVYLNLGTGLSAALVLGGHVVAGANGAAGEIGYHLREVPDVGLALSSRVPLEDMVSGQALARRAARLAQVPGRPPAGPPGGPPPGPPPGAPGTPAMTAAEVFAAGASDPRLDALLSEFVAELAYHVVNLAISINPARIAVGGGLVGSWDRLRPGLERALKAGTPFPPELVPARFPAEAPLIGAVALAADAAGAVIDGFPVSQPLRTLDERHQP
jgi:predicted NBD/HSP70 family sugar kinase